MAALAPFAPTGLRTRAPSRLGGPVLVSVVVHAAALAIAVFVSVRAARDRLDQRAIHVFLQPPSGPVAPLRAPAPPAAAPSPPVPAAPPAAPVARAAPAAPPVSPAKASPQKVSPPKTSPPRAEPRPKLPSTPATPVARAQPAERVVKAERSAPPAPARAAPEPAPASDALKRVLDRMQPAPGPLVAAAAGHPDAEASAAAAAAATEARAAAAVTFVDRVRAAVESVYEIPRGLSGAVLEAALRLRIDRSGRVLARSVEVPSFDPAFDAALLAVVDRIPSVPPPAEIVDTVSTRGIRVWFRSDDLARGASR